MQRCWAHIHTCVGTEGASEQLSGVLEAAERFLERGLRAEAESHRLQHHAQHAFIILGYCIDPFFSAVARSPARHQPMNGVKRQGHANAMARVALTFLLWP